MVSILSSFRRPHVLGGRHAAPAAAGGVSAPPGYRCRTTTDCRPRVDDAGAVSRDHAGHRDPLILVTADHDGHPRSCACTRVRSRAAQRTRAVAGAADAGFDVDAASTAAEALDRAALRVPDAVIVELTLPDGDGVDVCRRLRDWSAMPLIVVSATDDEDEKVRALDAGADDFVVKPFAPRELVARLSAFLRRAQRDDTEPPFMVGGLRIDLVARALRRGDEAIHLTPIEFNLLRVLLRHRGRPLTHLAVLQQIWGPAYVEDRQTLRRHIANLRRKLELAGAPAVIRTEHGIGYRFVGATRAGGRADGTAAVDRFERARRRAA